MKSSALTAFLVVALGGSTLTLVPRLGALHLPGNQQGYAPAQPIAFSHRLHAGELQVGCAYCHYGAEASRHAGIPAASACMNCHRFVTAPLGAVRLEDDLASREKRPARRIVSAELGKLYAALGLDDTLARVPGKPLRPIAWTKVHNLPDFATFEHRAHVGAGVACAQCHGAVEAVERVAQVQSLAMGFCVNCHRQVNRTGVAAKPVQASTDCSTCHF